MCHTSVELCGDRFWCAMIRSSALCPKMASQYNFSLRLVVVHRVDIFAVKNPYTEKKEENFAEEYGGFLLFFFCLKVIIDQQEELLPKTAFRNRER